jgi:hypothetical protein
MWATLSAPIGGFIFNSCKGEKLNQQIMRTHKKIGTHLSNFI